MIKIPATQAGYIAMRELTNRGIHVEMHVLVFHKNKQNVCNITWWGNKSFK